ncbi:MAG TPA: DUF6365 family protein, partial [Candidatus Angelobacter sp.]
ELAGKAKSTKGDSMQSSHKSSRKHLILSLGRKGFGEAMLGLRLAADLQQAGDEVFFLAHDSNAKLFEGRFRHLLFSSAASPLLQLYWSNCLSGFRASSIILSDYFTTTLFFVSFGLNPEMLTATGLPIFAIDTWDSSKAVLPIDILIDATRSVELWPGRIKPICPVPFLAPNDTPGAYNSLPEEVATTRRIRRHVRHTLGIGEQEKAVFFCTAEWQHPNYESQSDAARRCGALLPRLVAEYLSRLGNSVHLVHVGPKAYDLKAQMGTRYHWLPPLPPTEFDTLLASTDLLLTANISATTIAKAMVVGVPTLVLQNSISASTPEEAEAAMTRKPSPQLRAWLQDSVPLYPFALWPLGYHRFLGNILQNNPYVRGLELTELLDEEQVEAALARLLFDDSARQEHAHRQAAYLAQVRSLPMGPQVIQAGLAAA